MRELCVQPGVRVRASQTPQAGEFACTPVHAHAAPAGRRSWALSALASATPLAPTMVTHASHAWLTWKDQRCGPGRGSMRPVGARQAWCLCNYFWPAGSYCAHMQRLCAGGADGQAVFCLLSPSAVCCAVRAPAAEVLSAVRGAGTGDQAGNSAAIGWSVLPNNCTCPRRPSQGDGPACSVVLVLLPCSHVFVLVFASAEAVPSDWRAQHRGTRLPGV